MWRFIIGLRHPEHTYMQDQIIMGENQPANGQSKRDSNNIWYKNIGNSKYPRNKFLLSPLTEEPISSFHSCWLPSGAELKTGRIAVFHHTPQQREDGMEENMHTVSSLDTRNSLRVNQLLQLMDQICDSFWHSPAHLIEDAILLFGPPGVQTPQVI